MSTTVETWPIRQISGEVITEASFSDLFPNAVESIEWDGENNMRVTFEGDLTTNQQYQARRRIRTTVEMENLEKQAINAYSSINTYLAIASPTNAQVAAQVRLQAQVVQGLVKLTFPDAARELLGGL